MQIAVELAASPLLELLAISVDRSLCQLLLAMGIVAALTVAALITIKPDEAELVLVVSIGVCLENLDLPVVDLVAMHLGATDGASKRLNDRRRAIILTLGQVLVDEQRTNICLRALGLLEGRGIFLELRH